MGSMRQVDGLAKKIVEAVFEDKLVLVEGWG